ncbi:MAG: response regulator transcription factor, partial [Proteobacteria bacterium]|nr:response regulator transcription factor [Pseudomonadota bacterium]
DIAMPGMDGLTVLEKAKKIQPTLIAIIVTSYDDSAYLERALELGASAYVLKDGASECMQQCLEAINSGEIFISPSLGKPAPRLPDLNSTDGRALDILTEMERVVLSKVAEFKTSKEIAGDLNISFRTVQNHRANISSKLDLHGSHQLVSFARKHRNSLVGERGRTISRRHSERRSGVR